LIGSAAAVVGHNGSQDSDLTVTSERGFSSTAGSTVMAGENGTQTKATVEMIGKISNASDGISFANFSKGEFRKVEFQGTIRAPKACHVLQLEVEVMGKNYYTSNIQTVKDKLERNKAQVCAQVITPISYDASFQTEEEFTLEVKHNNQTVDTLEYENRNVNKSDLIRRIFKAIKNLF
jgi:hypothetical protein